MCISLCFNSVYTKASNVSETNKMETDNYSIKSDDLSDINHMNSVINQIRKISPECKKVTLELEQYVNQQSLNEKNLERYKKQIEECNDTETKEQLIVSYEETLRNQTVNTFYVDNCSEIKQERENAIIITYLSNYLSIPVYKDQIELLKSEKLLRNEEYRILKTLKRLGYTTANEVAKKKSEIRKLENNLVQYQNALMDAQDWLEKHLGFFPDGEYGYASELSIKNMEEYEKELYDKASLRVYDIQLEAYQTFALNCKQQISLSQVYVQDTDTKLRTLQNEKDQLILTSKLVIQQLCHQFEEKKEDYLYCLEKKKEMEALLKRNEVELKVGKIKKADYLKNKVEYYQIQYEMDTALYKMGSIYYQLELKVFRT